MNSSVSPLPLPIFPMLALSLALICVTSVAVTLSSRRATQIYRVSASNIETPAPAEFEIVKSSAL